MIAKGLDYERVTLVGILNADAMLNRGDYRSSELTYDLLEQACGRSGRGRQKGRVILQAYDGDHYAIRCAARHDYLGFSARDAVSSSGAVSALRLSFCAGHASSQEEVAREDARAAAQLLAQGRYKLLGPIGLGRIRDEHRFRLILKGKDRREQAAMLGTGGQDTSGTETKVKGRDRCRSDDAGMKEG